MKKAFKSTLAVAAVATAIAGVAAVPSIVNAWGPDRPTYSLEQINDPKTLNGKVNFNSIVIKDTDYAWYKQQTGKDIPAGTITDERNFVGARECIYDANTASQCATDGVNNVWYGNDITVEDGKTYLVRLYVHNNSIKTEAKDVHTKFFMPEGYKAVQSIDGQISAANAMYDKYWDYVNFKSADGTPFKIEYVEGSALLENNVFTSGKGGYKLGDELVKGANGAMIGYDSMNGVIPGCYDYDAYIGIRVKVTYEPQFTVEKKVRNLSSDDKSWQKTVEAKVGDIVEFQIEYTNTDKKIQKDVALRDVLPNNLEYVPGSTIYYNGAHPAGFIPDEDHLLNDGLKVGQYSPDANNIIRFKAKVIDQNLSCGSNTMVNWGQAGVDDVVRQDYARVHLNKVCENTPNEEPKKDEETPTNLPTTGPEAVAGGVIAAGSIVTAAGYYIASRRQLR